MTTFLSNRDIYTSVVCGIVPQARVRLWIATADIKDMYVDAGGWDMVPFLEVLDGMLKRGVELRLIHMRRSRIRPRRMRWVARRSVATEPRSGRKRSRERKRNFENGVLSDDPALVEPLVEQFDSVWRNAPGRSRQVPRRVTRGALRSKVARGCAIFVPIAGDATFAAVR